MAKSAYVVYEWSLRHCEKKDIGKIEYSNLEVGICGEDLGCWIRRAKKYLESMAINILGLQEIYPVRFFFNYLKPRPSRFLL